MIKFIQDLLAEYKDLLDSQHMVEQEMVVFVLEKWKEVIQIINFLHILDCVISHGASKFLKERLFDVSDAYRVHVCTRCGLIAVANFNKNQYNCLSCNR